MKTVAAPSIWPDLSDLAAVAASDPLAFYAALVGLTLAATAVAARYI